MKPEVVTMGEVMGTLRFSGQFGVGTTVTPSLAGAETNVAIALARLDHRASYIGSLGADTIGEGILRTLRGERVGVDHVAMRPEPTGILVSRIVGPETKRVDYHRSGSAGRIISPEQIEAALSEQPTILHITGITPALGQTARDAVFHAVSLAREHGITVSFDVNYRSRLWEADDARPVLESIARQADILFGGTEELALITGEYEPVAAMTQIAGWGVSDVVWKSSDLARSLSGGKLVEANNRLVQAVDPIGAGDAFVSGWLSARLDGLPIKERLVRAHVMGAIIVGIDGDWEGLPTRSELIARESTSSDSVRGGDVLR